MSQQTGETISVLCKCGKKLKAPASAVGKKAKCPKCGNVLVVQAPPPKQEDEFDALYDLAADSEKAAQQQDVAPRCPQCISPMPPGAVLCTNCGYDTRSGKNVAAPVAPLKASPIGKPAATGTRYDPAAAAAAEAAAKKQKKPKVADAMAPQGSFLKGVGFSIAGALIGGIVWFAVAYMFKWELSIIALAVGALAGAGMQMGQEGYSTLGGITAAAITFVVMIVAKIAVVLAVVLPMFGAESDLAEKYDERVVDMVIEQELAAKGGDVEDYSDEQYEAVLKSTKKKLASMPKSEYDALLAKAEAKEADDELLAYVHDDMLRAMNVDPEDPSEAQDAIAEKQAQAKIAKMSASEKKAELKRLQDLEEAEFQKALADAKAEADKLPASERRSGGGGSAVAGAVGFIMILLIVFGWKSAIFMLGALFVAYRTAAGSVSG